MLVSRPGEVVKKLVSSNKYAFRKERPLVDVVVVVIEVIDLTKKYRKSCLIFKVGYEETYNLLNYDFLSMFVRFEVNDK